MVLDASVPKAARQCAVRVSWRWRGPTRTYLAFHSALERLRNFRAPPVAGSECAVKTPTQSPPNGAHEAPQRSKSSVGKPLYVVR